MNKRRFNEEKFNRALSRRGELTGKPGNFVLTSALIGAAGKAVGAGAGAIFGSSQKKKQEEERAQILREQGLDYQEMESVKNTQLSEDVLSTYNPQGDAQMYAKNGAKMYTPYPYQDQPRTMINPTTMYKNGGKTTLSMVQNHDKELYWPQNNFNSLNNPGNVGRHRDNMDQRYPGSSQNFKNGGTLLQQVQTGDTSNYWPTLQNPIEANNPGNVGRHRDNMDHRYPGSSQNFQMGGTMFDELQDVGMQEYQRFQQGGAAEVPGGQLQDLGGGAQEVKGSNPELIDDVELGTNPGEPDAVVDNNEVIRDAVDEQGQPYKQIFSDTVLVPGKKTSMAKDAKKLIGQLPEDAESDQAKRINDKLDNLFDQQQMMNGDSEGETADEAAAGGMDPNAAMDMGQEGGQAFMNGGMMNDYVGPSYDGSPDGLSMSEKNRWGNLNHQRFQNGGAGYPSAGYDAALREQQMQVPYPKKNYASGGVWGDIATGIGGAAQGFMPGATMGYSLTDDIYGEKDPWMAAGAGAGLASGMVGNIADHQSQVNQKEYEDEQAKAQSTRTQSRAIQAANQSAGQGYSTMGATESDINQYGQQGLSQISPYKTEDELKGYPYQDGGRAYYEDGGSYQEGGVAIVMNPQNMYERARSFVDMYEDMMPLPNTLSDMQASANPQGWGQFNDNVSNRRHGHLMGRMHRAPGIDPTPVISGSERGGPTPKKRKKSFREGGRLYYGHSLYKKSLTLSIR